MALLVVDDLLPGGIYQLDLVIVYLLCLALVLAGILLFADHYFPGRKLYQLSHPGIILPGNLLIVYTRRIP